MTGRGNFHGLEPMAICLMSLGKVIQLGYQRAFYLQELGTDVNVNGETRMWGVWKPGRRLKGNKGVGLKKVKGTASSFC